MANYAAIRGTPAIRFRRVGRDDEMSRSMIALDSELRLRQVFHR